MKKIILTLTMLIVYATPASSAGIPVIDVSALSQDAAFYAKEILDMANQLTTMQSQLQQQIKHYESMIGDRGMGALMDGQIRNYIPSDWKDALSILDKPSVYSSLSASAQQYLQQNKVLTDEELNKIHPAVKKRVEEQRQLVAIRQALTDATFKNASERFTALQELTNRIGSATDPKAILDLQARIQSEQSMLANEAIKLQSLAESLKSHEAAQRQRRIEKSIKSGGRP